MWGISEIYLPILQEPAERRVLLTLKKILAPAKAAITPTLRLDTKTLMVGLANLHVLNTSIKCRIC